ncbi:MAG: ATP-binding cassette domain-containing protein [Clostridiales bacterium]|nr:ATP-binding cassette domain-containing protein [Clostridiales bacterium]
MKIILDNINVSYKDKIVIKDFSYTFENEGRYVIRGASGSGKTTLIKTVMGLKKVSEGKITFDEKPVFSAVFQEDRLIENISPVTNIAITSPEVPEEKIRNELACLLPKEVLDHKVSELSGGMKRRVCIVRAVLSASNILILDEPLTGLDETNQKIVLKYISEHLNGRILIAASHSDLFTDYGSTIILRENI